MGGSQRRTGGSLKKTGGAERSSAPDPPARNNQYEINPLVIDPWASKNDAMHEYGVELTPLSDIKDADCVVLAVAHDEFKRMELEDLDKLYKNKSSNEKILIDVKSVLNRKTFEDAGYNYWRL